MDCQHDCVHIVPAEDPQPEYENPINSHWEVSEAGYNYYFCATHRTRHCMFMDSSVDQPYCGECAPFYYQGYKNVVWFKQRDRQAVNNDPRMGMAIARELMLVNHTVLERQRDDYQHDRGPLNVGAPRGQEQAPVNLFAMPAAGDFPDFRDAIPRDDVTYLGIGHHLIGNPRQRGLFRLPFRDHAGAAGYMPCGLDIDRRPAFAHLAQYEEFGDPIFKAARTWACKYQGVVDLPRDIRWVLLSIYMLCNEVLYDSRENSEDTIWTMRGWLWYLNSLANKLFDEHLIHVVGLEEDWFHRPVGRFNPVPRLSVREYEWDTTGGQFTTPASSVVGSVDDLPTADSDGGDDDARSYEDEEGFSSAEDTPEESDSEAYY